MLEESGRYIGSAEPFGNSFRALLEKLGISAIAEWDVLTFVRRRGTTILDTGKMVRLIGYSQDVIEEALAKLTKAGLFQTSYLNGVGLYKFIPLATRQGCLEELIKMVDQRNGRVQLKRALDGPQ